MSKSAGPNCTQQPILAIALSRCTQAQFRMPRRTDSARSCAPTVAAAAEPATVAPPRPKKTLVVVGLPHAGAAQVDKVRGRLGQWSALGRQWAGDPQDWDIHIVMPDSASLTDLAERYTRWALWVNSDADAFATMYRVLRQLREHGGPRRLLALHEPHLPRRGLLDNLGNASARYLDIELLLLAR